MALFGSVSGIQHFSLGDGDGIRTTVFMAGCPLRCGWCHNPEALLLHSEDTKLYSAEQLMKEILEDSDFYAESGGGVTVSGGEPLAQSVFIKELGVVCGNNGISMTVDTAGNVPFEKIERVIPVASHFLYDLKSARAEDYTAIGGDFALVTGNLERLISSGAAVTVSVPVIPGFNCDIEHMRELSEVCSRLGVKARLLPFHRLASSKYTEKGMNYAYGNVTPPGADVISEYETLFA